jgi:putative transposase
VHSYLADLAGQRGENGRRLVVRNGYHRPRQAATSAGLIEVKGPR